MSRPLTITLVTLALMVVLDVLLGRSLPGFYAAYGLLSCVVIILASKWLGKYWLQRGEDYYEEAPLGRREDTR